MAESKVVQTAKKVLDTEKIMANAMDVFAVLLGVGGGLVVHNLAKGKLPFGNITEPLVTALPGLAGAILFDRNSFERYAAIGFTCVGAGDGVLKVVNAVPFLSFAKPYAPKLANEKGGVGKLGNINDKNSVLLGVSGGSQSMINNRVPVWM